MEDYRRIADAVAADIASGALRPGDRLPPQRAFARERGIAASTASRVYGELVRRGLAVGEVGRGTFVRAAGPRPSSALTEPSAGARTDLELNYPIVAGQASLLAGGLGRMLRPDVLGSALAPLGVAGTPAAREAVAGLLAVADPGRVLFAGNGRQAIAGAVAALARPGERLAAEALTYPVVKAIAARLGVTLVPVEVDGDGMVPDALAEAARRHGPLRGAYLQPTLHNPYGTTMSAERRAELAAMLDRLGLDAIEDRVWAFLSPDAPPPLAAFAPDRTILVDSLSKRLAPGLTVGFAAAPPPLAERVAAALRSGGWGPGGFALDAATGWIADGTVDAIVGAKRDDAAARQRIAAELLPEAGVRTDPHAYFCWWDLPAPWRAETFVAAAGRRGIAVTPGAAFAVGSGSAPRAVRIGLASPPPEVLGRALGALAEIARGTPDDSAPD